MLMISFYADDSKHIRIFFCTCQVTLLRFTLALDVLRHQQVVSVVDDISEVADPVAEDNHPCLFRQLEVEFDMAMAIDEVVDIGMILDIFLRIEHEMLTVFSHVGRLLAVRPLQPRVLGPVQSEPHAPAGMYGRKHPLAHGRMEDAANELKRLTWVAQSVAVGQEEHLSIDLCRFRLLVQDDTTLLLQIIVGPDIVVAGEVMHLDAHVRQFRDFPKESGEAFRHHIFIFIPEVEHVAQQIHCRRLLLDGVEESHESALLHPLVRNGQRP